MFCNKYDFRNCIVLFQAVVINAEHEVVEDTTNLDDYAFRTTPLVTPKDLEHQVKVTHSSGSDIIVALGDMVECRVDVIVNAANEHLAHHAGLAAAIVKKGDKAFKACRM